jgi:hypothetical protein
MGYEHSVFEFWEDVELLAIFASMHLLRTGV